MAKLWMYQGSMLSWNWQDGVLSELLYADDLVLISETINRPRNKFIKWKEVFEQVFQS